jgi:hypothetical protein
MYSERTGRHATTANRKTRSKAQPFMIIQAIINLTDFKRLPKTPAAETEKKKLIKTKTH